MLLQHRQSNVGNHLAEAGVGADQPEGGIDMKHHHVFLVGRKSRTQETDRALLVASQGLDPRQIVAKALSQIELATLLGTHLGEHAAEATRSQAMRAGIRHRYARQVAAHPPDRPELTEIGGVITLRQIDEGKVSVRGAQVGARSVRTGQQRHRFFGPAGAEKSQPLAGEDGWRSRVEPLRFPDFGKRVVETAEVQKGVGKPVPYLGRAGVDVPGPLEMRDAILEPAQPIELGKSERTVRIGIGWVELDRAPTRFRGRGIGVGWGHRAVFAQQVVGVGEPRMGGGIAGMIFAAPSNNSTALARLSGVRFSHW